MDLKTVRQSLSLRAKFIIGLLLLAFIPLLVYVVANRESVQTLITQAATSTCTNGAKKREDTFWYVCRNGAWVIDTSTSTTNTSTPTITTAASSTCAGTCAYTNQTKQCGGSTYCCPGTGKQWVKGACQSGVVAPPINAQTTVQQVAQVNPFVSSNTAPAANATSNGSGSAPPPPQQKKTTQQKKNPSASTNKTGSTTAGAPSQACNDYGCSNTLQGNLWGLNNCSPSDPDGDMQLCDAKGRIGVCQSKQLCCPGPGLKWTLDMTACPVTKASITVSPATLNSSAPLTVSYTGIPAPSTSDWFGMYKQNETDERNPYEWNYVNSSGTCAKTKGDGKSTGTCTFTLRTGIPSGTYELRLFSTDSYSRIAVSNVFTITTSGTGTPTGSPPGNCCACPSPTPYFAASQCNGPCMTSQNCQNGQVCLLADNYGWVCRNPACADTSSCSCSASGLTNTPTSTPVYTPTPTPSSLSQAAICNETCTSTSQCKSGYQCVYLNDAVTAVCRNPKCYSSQSCVCPKVISTAAPTSPPKGGTEVGGTGTPTYTPTLTPTGASEATLSGTPTPTGVRLDAIPSITPTPTPIPINPRLEIKPFTDSTGKAPQKFTVSGISDPYTEIEIRFDPDAIGQTTTADEKGNWRYILTKSLTTGNKELTVNARGVSGGETQIKQSFTVKSGRSFFSLFIGFFMLALIGGIGFFIYQKQMNDQSSLFSQFPSVSSDDSSFTPPAENTPTSEEKTISPNEPETVQTYTETDTETSTVKEEENPPFS